jgi:hypothetical protein
MRSAPVPRSFAEEVDRAAAAKDVAYLGLLAAEASGFTWAVEGWRKVGKALLDLGAWPTAMQTLERIYKVDADFADRELKGDRIAACLEMSAPFRHDGEVPSAHVVVFTGHRVDQRGRPEPRFPASCVEAARAEMRARLPRLAPSLGIAAAASGGDILFHEVCAELNVPTQVSLVMPPQNFVNASVIDAGPEWVERYWNLIHAKQKEGRLIQLNDRDELPAWLKGKRDYEIWNRANLWMLERALAMVPTRLTVMALWDGKDTGDGPGGTSDLLARATELNASTDIISTETICP